AALRVAGQLGAGARDPPGVGAEEPLLERGAGLRGATGETANVAERAVELDDPPAPRLLVQAVDVLGDHADQRAGGFHRRQRPVRGVRARAPEPLPAERRARPIAPAHVGAAQERVVLDRIAGPGPAAAAVIGDPRLRAAAGAGERDGAASGQQPPQRLDLTGGIVPVALGRLSAGRWGQGRARHSSSMPHRSRPPPTASRRRSSIIDACVPGPGRISPGPATSDYYRTP